MSQDPSRFKEAILSRNHVTIRGSGEQTMLFAHGFGCDQNMWRLVAPAFESEYRCVLFDYVGSGNSQYSTFDVDRYSTLEGYAQDILEVCEALDLEDAIFVGHSVSAMIGLLAAVRQPRRFASLIMLGPSPCYLNHPPDYSGGFEREDIDGLLALMDHNYLGWAQQFAPAVMANADRKELTAELEGSFCSTDPVTARTFARATFFADNRTDLPKLTRPALILQVKDDSIVPVSIGHYLHEQLIGSHLVVLDAEGHCPHVSHPEDTIRAMREFLDARHGAA